MGWVTVSSPRVSLNPMISKVIVVRSIKQSQRRSDSGYHGVAVGSSLVHGSDYPGVIPALYAA